MQKVINIFIVKELTCLKWFGSKFVSITDPIYFKVTYFEVHDNFRLSCWISLLVKLKKSINWYYMRLWSQVFLILLKKLLLLLLL
jgi:hypothetical protein